jgi:general secretion pathway protein M
MKLLDWYQSLAEKERRTVLYGGVAAVLLLLVGGLWKLDAAAGTAERRVLAKRADLAWMQAVAPRLQAMPAVDPNESLPLLVDRTTRGTGLAGTVASTNPAGAGGLRVRLEEAPFDAVVIWLGRLQQERGVIVQLATFDKGASEGLVNATVELRGP